MRDNNLFYKVYDKYIFGTLLNISAELKLPTTFCYRVEIAYFLVYAWQPIVLVTN